MRVSTGKTYSLAKSTVFIPVALKKCRIVTSKIVFSALLSDPLIQKAHLLVGMEPMLPAGHNGQLRMVPLGKRGYRFNGCQAVMLAIQISLLGKNVRNSFFASQGVCAW